MADGRQLDNWIQAYLAYTAESESPEEFHKWVAISVIAGALKRRVFFDMGYFQLFTNNYVILVSPPGRCKKSTAMRIGREFLQSLPDFKFTSDSVTRERLIQDLTQSVKDGHSSMTAHSSEFATMLTSSGVDMMSFLTDIYDCPANWEHSSKSGGVNKIKAPWLNLLGATTPDWIAHAMPMDTVGIGLTSRIVFVYQDTPRVKDPFPTLGQDQIKLQPLLTHDLNQIAMIGGEYRLSPEAREFYTAWYKERLADPNPTHDSRLNGYYERKPMHLLKIAMVVAASFTNDLVLSSNDIAIALALLEDVEEKMPRVFANVGKNPLSADIDLVEQAIIAAPDGLPMAILTARFKHSLGKDQLAEVLESLLIMKKVMLAGNHNYVAIR